MGNAGCCSSNDANLQFETLTAPRDIVGRKKALLVGLNYRNTRAELHGCSNDVNNMQQVLVKQNGFKLEDILMLNEDQDKSQWPYKKVIIEGFANYDEYDYPTLTRKQHAEKIAIPALRAYLQNVNQ